MNLLSNIHGLKIDDGPSFTVVDDEAGLSDMIDNLEGLPVIPPSIYVDLEGIKLSRHGSISILQIYVLPRDHTYLVDVHQLRDKAFSSHGRKYNTCLKAILEDKDIPKVFFDVRNDSDALFCHYQISLSGVDDIQLMELATRTFSRIRVNGLQKCIERDIRMTTAEKIASTATKEKGKELFLPESGGRYEVFNERPLVPEIIQYCVQDVRFLPQLWTRYATRMTASWKEKVETEAKARISASQSPSYISHGEHKAFAPAGWNTPKAAANRRTGTWTSWDNL